LKIYQIEISNRCNLTCSYCPHPTQAREQGLMSWETFTKSIELVERCGQRTAYLHNFGEPLLHPHLVEFVRHCSDRGISASFFTNGVLVTHQVLADLADAGGHTAWDRAFLDAGIAGDALLGDAGVGSK
jgi:MoaA/NifB/PqqE/SkfB family radical SAM enzyme